jgi:hypothetical protein
MENPIGVIVFAIGTALVGAVAGFVGGCFYTTRKLATGEIAQLKEMAQGGLASPELQQDIMEQIQQLATKDGFDPNSIEGLTYGARKLLEEGGLSFEDFPFGSMDSTEEDSNGR